MFLGSKTETKFLVHFHLWLGDGDTSIGTCQAKVPTHLRDDLSKARVTHDQPATGRDAIGLVLELMRVHLIEILEPVQE